ncbi:MAG TPA: RidA family protein [Vicinamibacteria bacterium]
MKTFTPTGSAAPGGHYSHAAAAGGFVFVSGQLPIGPDGARDPGLGFGEQSRLALANLKAALDAAGARLEDVVKVTVYVSSIEGWAEFNAAYAELFGSHRPARAVVPVGPLHYGFAVEVEAVAFVGA